MTEAFRYPVSPRYYEVDGQGVVFNMWYLGWFDEASTGFMAFVGYPYERLEADRIDLQVVHTEVDWRSGVRLGDAVTIEVEVVRLGRTSVSLSFEVERNGDSLVSGRTVYVMVRAGAPVPVPDGLRLALAARLA
jgi:acyl-CoA thioester hydrolase